MTETTDVVARLRAMHKPRTERPGSCCVQCGIVWPCPTSRVLDDAEPAVVPSAPADRAAILREAADALVAVAGQHPEARAVVIHWGDAAALLRTMAQEECDESEAQGHLDELADDLSRMTDGAQQPTSCSQPNPCEDGEMCGVHEVEQAHAKGEHEYCGPTCEVEFPTELLRNTILHRAVPGSAGMLDELLRRAATGQLPAVEARQADTAGEQPAT